MAEARLREAQALIPGAPPPSARAAGPSGPSPAMEVPSRALAGADGVRALACLWVFGHHVVLLLDLPQRGVGKLLGRHGPLGVVVFFVLSGFLLARPWWRALEGGGPPPDLRAYARRRAARIVPAYAVCLVVSFLVFGAFTARDGLRLAAGLAFLSAFHPVTYFPVEGNSPCWSLGVEGVFYACLPLVGLALARARSLRAGRLVTLGALLLVLAAQAVVVATVPPPTPPANASGLVRLAAAWLPERSPLGLLPHLLVGVLAASFVAARADDPPRGRGGDLLALAALAALVVEVGWRGPGAGLASLDAAWASRHVPGVHGRFPGFPVAVGALLVGLARSRVLGRALDAAPLRATATLSYGLYLWHVPVLLGIVAALRPGRGAAEVALVTVLGLAASYAAAWLSWTFVERPVLRRARGRAVSA